MAAKGEEPAAAEAGGGARGAEAAAAAESEGAKGEGAAKEREPSPRLTRRDAVFRIAGAAAWGTTGAVLGWGLVRGRHSFVIEEVVVRIARLPRALDGYTSVQPLPSEHRRRFWLHLLRNMITKAVIRVGAGYFKRADNFFLIGPGGTGLSLEAATRRRLDMALNGLRENTDPSTL